ncbi:MAG: hypothetical protein JWM86_2825 [Thermoleophilia bacterium]|nr:hypothetical protein [Thermoleophilia bacterium]
MPESLRSNLDRRRYRLAQALTVAGSLAVGSIVVERLFSVFREDFFLYYRVSDTEYHEMRAAADGALPLTLGALLLGLIAFISVCGFIWAERRRLRQTCDLDHACRRKRTRLVVERLSPQSLFDTFVTRTSAFAGVLLAIWLLQSSLERALSGYGWGLEYANWRSLLPLVSVFGLCVLSGMLVAAVSLVGLRAIHVLERALATVFRRRPRMRVLVRRSCASAVGVLRTLRELIGCDILSRPPPIAC